jgi:transglutaminase-like putative cysteine protease
VAKGLAKESSCEGDFVSKVYEYVCKKVTYDYDLAATVESGYIPEPDKILSSGKGICFDYASLAASMLRSQGIPTKIIFGYVAPDNLYHAWNMFYTEKEGWSSVEFKVNPKKWNRIDLTFYANGEDEEFIGDGSNYTEVYQY